MTTTGGVLNRPQSGGSRCSTAAHAAAASARCRAAAGTPRLPAAGAARPAAQRSLAGQLQRQPLLRHVQQRLRLGAGQQGAEDVAQQLVRQVGIRGRLRRHADNQRHSAQAERVAQCAQAVTCRCMMLTLAQRREPAGACRHWQQSGGGGQSRRRRARKGMSGAGWPAHACPGAVQAREGPWTASVRRAAAEARPAAAAGVGWVWQSSEGPAGAVQVQSAPHMQRRVSQPCLMPALTMAGGASRCHFRRLAC